MKITGTVVGSVSVVRDFDKAAAHGAMDQVRTAVHALGFMLERKVKMEKLNGQVLRRRTGRLFRSINTRFQDNANVAKAIVGTSLSYARIWEVTGSRAFVIRPKEKQALFWPGAAHPVRAVRHPEQRPRPFLRPALDEMRPTIRATIGAAMTNVVKKS